MAKVSVGISLDQELAEWALTRASLYGFKNRNLLMEHLLVEFRRKVEPVSVPNAFPGESPDHPLLVSLLNPQS